LRGTFLPLNSEFSGFSFKSVHDLIKQYQNSFNTVQGYVDHYAGRVEPLNADYCLLDEVYFYLSRGLMSPQ
ncbi:1339_t:CDS:2, partial [Gigaspora margarita]